MRSLKEYLVTEYMAQDLNDKLMIDNRVISSDITLQDLKDAGWGSSMLDDKSWIVVDNQEFYKIKKDGWQKHSTQAISNQKNTHSCLLCSFHILGNIVSNHKTLFGTYPKPACNLLVVFGIWLAVTDIFIGCI